MGKHTALPEKTDIPHKAVRIVRTRTHTWLVFCKHFIVESSAGFLAIILFEAYRSEWLNMLGHDETGQIHAMHILLMNNSMW